MKLLQKLFPSRFPSVGKKWLTTESRLSFPTTISIETAKERTLTAAREKVVRKMLPPGVVMEDLIRDLFVDIEHLDADSARSLFCISSAAGYIVDEKIHVMKAENFQDNRFDYTVRLSACIEPLQGEHDPSLKLDLQVNRSDFTEGEELVVTATSSHEGYLYLFDFLADQSVVLMYPLKFIGGPSIRAGQPMRIPPESTDPEHPIGEYHVIAERDREITVETLYGLFCLQPVKAIEKFFTVEGIKASFSAGNESFHMFQRLLAEIPPRQRTEKAVQIRIRPAKREFF